MSDSRRSTRQPPRTSSASAVVVSETLRARGVEVFGLLRMPVPPPVHLRELYNASRSIACLQGPGFPRPPADPARGLPWPKLTGDLAAAQRAGRPRKLPAFTTCRRRSGRDAPRGARLVLAHATVEYRDPRAGRSRCALLGRARIDHVVLDVRARSARRAVIGPVAREDDAPPVRRRGRVRLAAVAPAEGAVLVGEALDRLAPVQLHRDDLGAEALAVLHLVVDVRPARAIDVARRDVAREGLVVRIGERGDLAVAQAGHHDVRDDHPVHLARRWETLVPADEHVLVVVERVDRHVGVAEGVDVAVRRGAVALVARR